MSHERAKERGWWLSVASVVLSGLIGAGPAWADQTAADFLKPYVTWAKSAPAYRHLGITMSSHHFTGEVTCAAGELVYGLGQWGHQGFTASGVEQFFNNRLWQEPAGPVGDEPVFPKTHPFSPYATDKLKVNLNATLGILYLQLPDGSSRQVDLHAANGMLMGNVQPTSPRVLFTPTVILSVKKITVPSEPN